eukprot:3955168-Amphidinium_carterae.1
MGSFLVNAEIAESGVTSAVSVGLKEVVLRKGLGGKRCYLTLEQQFRHSLNPLPRISVPNRAGWDHRQEV